MYKILISLILFSSIFANDDFDIETLRAKQKVDIEQNRVNFRNLIQKHIKNGTYDDATKRKLLKQYSSGKNVVINTYKKVDSYRIDELRADLKYNGGLTNTGSEPKNADADIDIVANNEKAFEKHKKYWIKKYGKDNIKIEGYKITNKKTDTVMWKSEAMLSDAERRAISKDHDAYITSGGKHSTSVRSKKIKSSKIGSGLDPLRKLTYGIKHNIIKDVGKSLVKITTSADGKSLTTHIEKGTLLEHKSSNQEQMKENKLLKQASDLKQYKDSIEAGIIDLEDSPKTARKKEKQFEKDCLNLAIEKQNRLDIADQRKKRIFKHMIETFPKGSKKRKELQDKLNISEKSNRLARKLVNNSLEKIGVKKRLLTRAKIAKTEYKMHLEREQNRDLEKEKLLKKASDRKTKNRSKSKKKIKISKMKSASFLATAYQLNESANDTIKAGGNNFVTINENDSQLTKNIKAYVGVGIESTTFGGAFTAGKRADEEEKQRIMDAIKKGETLNPLVSFVRASFWGFAYVAKDMALGSLEYTKNKLVELDTEIRSAIKDSVRRKYSTEFQEKSQKLLDKKRQKREAKKVKETKNQKWDNFLVKNKKDIEKGQSKTIASLDSKINKEKQKERKSKISQDQFTSSFTAGEKSIIKYREKVQDIAQMKKDLARIKRETAATQKRIDEQWDFSGFSEGLSIVAGAVGEGAKEYQKQQSTKYSKKRDTSWADEKDSDYDPNWNRQVAEAFNENDKPVRKQRKTKSYSNVSCQSYGQTAVQQQRENLNLNCGFSGYKWNSSSSYHSNWCKKGNQGLTGSETNIRDKKLIECKKKGTCKPNKTHLLRFKVPNSLVKDQRVDIYSKKCREFNLAVNVCGYNLYVSKWFKDVWKPQNNNYKLYLINNQLIKKCNKISFP